MRLACERTAGARQSLVSTGAEALRRGESGYNMSEYGLRDETPTVLVVSDDHDLGDTYSVWLESEYDVRTTYSGSSGLTWYDPTVDIVLLDRHIPDLSGVEVVHNMAERDVDDQRALLTGADPGSELADLPCDACLRKPVTKAELRDTVRELQIRSKLDDELQRHFTLTSKIAALESSNAAETDDAIASLRRKAGRVRDRIEDRLDGLDEFEAGFRTIE